MRLVLVVNAYAPVLGGGEEHARQLARALVARGHRVQVLTGAVRSVVDYQGTEAPPLDAPAREVLDGVEVQRLPLSGRLLALVNWLKTKPVPGRGEFRQWARHLLAHTFERHLRRALRRARPDAVIALGHPHRPLRALARERAARPFPFVVAPLHHEFDPWLDREAEHEVLARADAVVVNTPHEADLLAGSAGVPRERLVVGGLGVHAPSTLPPDAREPLVLFVGRKTVAKGLPLLIEAFRRLGGGGPEDAQAPRLVLAGARWADSEQVEQAVAALPPEVRARVASPYDVSEAEKEAWLSRAACLVLPSRIESFGLVLLEAWARATPVVTFDLPVFRCTVEHGRDGLLVPPDDPAALAAALGRLLGEPALARRLGAAGRAQALAAHTWDGVAARYEQAVAQARERAGAPGRR